MASSKILELASTIHIHTKIIHDHLLSENLPFPSFEIDSPVRLQLPPEIIKSQNAVLSASYDLTALMVGPIGILTFAADHHINQASLHFINRFKIADCFTSEEEATFGEISDRCGLRESDTRRMLRHAMTSHIFQEPQEGIVAHTAASKVLSEFPLMSQWVGMVCEEMWPAATKLVDAMTRWPNSEEPNETGFNMAHNTDLPIYEELAKYPQRAQRFGDAMTLFNSDQGFEPSYLVDNYDFANIHTGTVVDVGGSHGSVSIEIVQKHPNLHCVVQDFAPVIEEGKRQLPSNLAKQISFMEHDFFNKQPVKGADVYFFRWIFHNWSDKYAIKILRNLIPALKKGARVIINEVCLPKQGAITALMERTGRDFDLVMQELQNGKERDAQEWAELFEAAHKEFFFVGVKVPTGSKLAIIEAIWHGENLSEKL